MAKGTEAMKPNDPGLYLLRDGTYADPAECSPGDDGVLRHANGVPVALRDDGQPHTLGDSTAANAPAAEAGKAEMAESEAEAEAAMPAAPARAEPPAEPAPAPAAADKSKSQMKSE